MANLFNKLFLSLIALNCLFGGATLAMDFIVHPGNVSANLTPVLATGEIVSGDTVKLKSVLASLPVRKNTALYLSSPGGNLYEGMRLGLFFRANGIKTVIEGASDCASACAIAFLGGTDRNGKTWRSSSSNSRLGFHAFAGNDGPQLNSDEVQRVVSDLLNYGKAVDAPIELLISGFATPSNSIYWVPQVDICKLGIKLWSVDKNSFICN